MFDFSSHQVTQLKIFTNQFAAAFRKRATTPAEIATRQAAVRAVKKEPCDRARNGRSANLCHSPLPLTAANSSAGGRKSSSSKEVVSVLIDPNELPDLTDIPTGQLLSLSLSLGVLSFESHSLSHTHSFSSLLSLSQSLSLTHSHPLSPQGFYLSLSLFLSSDMLQDTAHPVATIDYDEEEEDVEMWSNLNTYLTDEPPHIRPFYFQPRYHYGLDPAYHPALIHNTSLPSRPLPPPPPHSRQMTAARKTTSSVSGTGPLVPDASGAGAGAGSSGDGGVDQEMLWSSVAVFGTDPGNGSTDEADSFGLGLLGKSL